MIRRLMLIALIACSTLMTGCAVNRATASADPKLRWDAIKSVHVKQLEGEDGSTKKLIAEKFAAKGYAVTSDPQPNPQADAIITYRDKWMWDITMYMLELTINVRDPKTDYPLASGNSYHTSLTRKAPKDMVDEVVENILKAKP